MNFRPVLASSTLVLLGACTSTSPSSSTTSSSSGSPVTLAIAPTDAKVATCRTAKFEATPSDKVTWAVEGEGSIVEGLYTAPIRVPASPNATVKATRETASATAKITLATAFPEASVDAGRNATQTFTDFVHGVAARGSQVYAIAQGEKGSVRVAASSDGGLTFAAPLPVATGQNAFAMSIAVDASDDKVVHVAVHEDTNEIGAILTIYTSTDGAKTFTGRRIYTGGNGDVIDADIVSSAPGSVTVAAPTSWQDGAGHQGSMLLVWSDGNKGEGFGALTDLNNGYSAKWFPGFKKQLADKHLVEANDLRGGPHLGTNGKGKLCLSYADYDINGNGESHVLMCSTDGGASFGAPVTTATTAKPADAARPRVAIGPDGSLVVVAFNTWTNGALETGPQTKYVVSSDGGVTFGAPFTHPAVNDTNGNPKKLEDGEVVIDGAGVIWFARTVGREGVQVDKSCDQGKTLSGALLLPITGTHRNGVFFESKAGIFAGAIRAGAGDTGLTFTRLLAP
ncbi:MAG: sialidase family protein [Polyangiaceae bacterium]